MNKDEFLGALDKALGGLPPEERQSAMQYYEDYLADAGAANEAEAIAGLGSPEAVAQAILNDYRELAPRPGAQDAAGGAKSAYEKQRQIKKGISPWVLLILVVLAIPIGIPLAAGGFSVVLALVVSLITAIICAFIAPLVLCIVGVALVWAGCAALLVTPASGVLAIGAGLTLLSLGMLLALLLVKLCMLFIPPLVRGFVNLCRKPFEKRRNKP